MNYNISTLNKRLVGAWGGEGIATITSKPFSCAKAMIPAMSATRKVGLDTTSTKIALVPGRIAARIAAISVGSASVVEIPKRGKSSVNSYRVVPYSWSLPIR